MVLLAILARLDVVRKDRPCRFTSWWYWQVSRLAISHALFCWPQLSKHTSDIYYVSRNLKFEVFYNFFPCIDIVYHTNVSTRSVIKFFSFKAPIWKWNSLRKIDLPWASFVHSILEPQDFSQELLAGSLCSLILINFPTTPLLFPIPPPT